jgi:hypothetical protein
VEARFVDGIDEIGLVADTVRWPMATSRNRTFTALLIAALIVLSEATILLDVAGSREVLDVRDADATLADNL